ncbi:hypothetical protein M3Y98_00228700 [Aphelenchoides besseyi]|nr:hypothetical protein M3Y98_00228700 [Aphelenchoides besseyi]KAI6200566.1 hypothetical protein M3Y96_00747600 [Aphelenchoides besseyi]
MAATTIQQLAEMDAFKRRERRKQRILENADKRLASLLAGSNGETRSAPCVDGATFCSKRSAFQSPEPKNSSTSTCKSSPCRSETLDLLSDAVEDDDPITYVVPKYVDYIDKTRFWIASTFGVFLAVLSIFFDVGSVLLPTLLLVISYETLAFRSKKVRYPKHGYIVNAILAAGFNEDLVINMGLLIDIGWEVVNDVCLVTFGFLIIKTLENAISGFM